LEVKVAKYEKLADSLTNKKTFFSDKEMTLSIDVKENLLLQWLKGLINNPPSRIFTFFTNLKNLLKILASLVLR